MAKTYDQILSQWKRLQHIRQTPEWLRFGSDMDHATQYWRLKSMVLSNQDALYDLLFSGVITDRNELHELMFFGGHGGSVAKEDNKHWIPFLKRVFANRTMFPKDMHERLDHEYKWYGDTHHYWED